jgi:hypothetical protein
LSNRHTRIWVIYTLIYCLSLPASAQEEQKAEIVAIIQRIEGSATLKQSQGGKPIPLNSRQDLARMIHFGEWIQVAQGSTLHIVDLRSKHPLEATVKTGANEKAEWITFPHQPTEEQAHLWKVLKAFSELGGRNSGGETAIFVPANKSVVRPEHLVFRWIPLRSAARVTLTLADRQHKVIWQQADVDGRSGRLESAKAQTAMKNYRASGHDGELILSLSPGTKKPMSIRFSLLDPNAEKDLQTQLAEWETIHGFLHHLGRAYSLTALDLHCEAAEEYEAALTAAPQSTSLLIAAIITEEQIGNASRGKALRKRLPSGTHVPGDQ